MAREKGSSRPQRRLGGPVLEAPENAMNHRLECYARCHGVDLEPLYNAINPTALDLLFAWTNTCERSQGAVTFEYAGRCVTVDNSGRVTLTPAETESSRADR